MKNINTKINKLGWNASFQRYWLSFKSGYAKKLELAYDNELLCPYDSLNQKSEPYLLVDMFWPDIYNYLINHLKDLFTNQSLKASKSIDAYNFCSCLRCVLSWICRIFQALLPHVRVMSCV